MKLRVAYAKRRYKDKVYETPLVVTSYRDEHGTSRNKTIVSLAKLPKYIVKLVEEGLKRGDASILDDYAPVQKIEYAGSVVVGPAFVVLTVLKQLGIYDAVMTSLPPQQATAIVNILVERVVSAKPLSVMAQQRRFGQEPLAFLLDKKEAPAFEDVVCGVEDAGEPARVHAVRTVRTQPCAKRSLPLRYHVELFRGGDLSARRVWI